jgi:hypothetical protein
MPEICFLGSCPIEYFFSAVMPYTYHRNADDRIANKMLQADPEGDRNLEAVVINYEAGLDRAIVELTALFDLHKWHDEMLARRETDLWEKAATSLIAAKYNKGLRGVNSNISRAVGLWLWDFTAARHNEKGIISEAIKAFRNEFISTPLLEIENMEEPDLRFFLRKTSDCIRDCRVFPFTKKREPKK